MTENVTLNGGMPWTVAAIERLVALWREGVAPELVAHALGRPENEVRAKASELRLPQHVEHPA